jgi:hypothetical protein
MVKSLEMRQSAGEILEQNPSQRLVRHGLHGLRYSLSSLET